MIGVQEQTVIQLFPLPDSDLYLRQLYQLQPFHLYFIRIHWDGSFTVKGFQYRIEDSRVYGKRVKLWLSNIFLPVMVEVDDQIFALKYVRPS